MPRSEEQVLALLDEYFDPAPPSLELGRGDDCAEFSVHGPLALSTDLFLEDIHFRRAYFLPEEIGRKALAVNLSDLAAAGAAPLAFSMGLICPPDMGEDWLRPLFRGMAALADEHRLVLSGGDISAGDKLGFCLTIWGRRAGPERFLRRGALPGQTIFAVGPSCAPPKTPGCSLGLARLGLLLLEERGREAEAEYPAACSALLRPRPQIEAAAVLAGLAHTPEDIFLMDVSDGLMRDLPRLLGGGRAKPDAPDAPGAELNLDAALLHPELRAFAHRAAKGVEDETQKIMLEFALTGGDDYLLLGAAKAELIPQIRAGLPKHSSLTPLGQVEPTPGLRRQGRPLEEVLRTRAFDHFS